MVLKKTHCENPTVCKAKYERWARNQKRFVPIGEDELDVFRKSFDKELAEFKLTSHYKKRSFERSISKVDLNEVLEFGWVIERNINSKQDVFLNVLAYTSQKRPLHIIFRVDSGNFWSVITGYNPRSDKRKWSSDYQQRICFCEKDEWMD